MVQKVAVLNIVALSSSLLEYAPTISEYASQHTAKIINQDFPAVTTTSQSSMLTGEKPSTHGVVGNGWFNHQANEIQFWKQSNALVSGEMVWDAAKKMDPTSTVANFFWWYNMYSSADYSVTPRPIYKANGRKHPDCYTFPADLRDNLQEKLGVFPLFNFWGPNANIKSTQWIADAAIETFKKHEPTLNFVYLPHLDYPLQKIGPNHPEIPKYVKEIDDVVKQLLDFYASQNVEVILLSEYGITPVSKPIHINRVLRKKFPDDISIRIEENLELLDAGASQIFAVSDHQVSHLYIKNSNKIQFYKKYLETIDGIQYVLDKAAQKKLKIDHPRSGELLLISNTDRWFTYYYWLDDKKAPDFARTVDIHRKPGYDPCELFLDPNIKFPKLKIILKLFQKKILNQATLLDVIPLDANLVKGSHGNTETDDCYKSIIISPRALDTLDNCIDNTEVKQLILSLMFD